MTDQPAVPDEGPDEVENDDLPVEPDLLEDDPATDTDDIADDDLPDVDDTDEEA